MDKSADRELIVGRLAEDLIGPHAEDEILVSRPTDVYLTGILWPQQTLMGGEDDDSLVAGGAAGGDGGDETEAAAVPASSVRKPSVAGVSVSLVSDGAPVLGMECAFARYRLKEGAEKGQPRWERVPVVVRIEGHTLADGSHVVDLGDHDERAAGALLHFRCIRGAGGRLATVSLINSVEAGEGRDGLDLASMFQTSMVIRPGPGTKIVPRPTRRGVADPDEHSDEQSGALLFRGCHSFATGHTCSARWETFAGEGVEPAAAEVATSWLPDAVVPGVSSSGHAIFERLKSGGGGIDPLDARALAEADPAALRTALDAMCNCYGDWLGLQREKMSPFEGETLKAARDNIDVCEAVLERLQAAVGTICREEDLLISPGQAGLGIVARVDGPRMGVDGRDLHGEGGVADVGMETGPDLRDRRPGEADHPRLRRGEALLRHEVPQPRARDRGLAGPGAGVDDEALRAAGLDNGLLRPVPFGNQRACCLRRQGKVSGLLALASRAS